MIYHYTTISTLDLIFESKKFRFTKLIHVDDEDETSKFIGPFYPSEYIFVSCWTKISEENLTLWNCYSKGDTGGVRIGLPDMPLNLYYLAYNDVITKEEKINYDCPLLLPNICPIEEDHFLLSNFFIEEDFRKEIAYLNDEELENTYLEYSRTSYDSLTQTITLGEIAKWKHKRWAAQKEFRFILTILPQSREFITGENKNFIQGILHSISIKKRLPFEFYDLSLSPQALTTIEITQSRYSTKEQNTHLKDVLEKHNLQIKPSKSEFNIKTKGDI